MKRVIFIGLIPLFSLALAAIHFRQTSATQALSCEEPSASISQMDYVNGLAIGTHDFAINNNTNQDIYFKGVSISCSCTTATPPDCIKAHSRGHLKAKMTLPPSQFTNKTVQLILVQQNQDAQKLKFSLTGRAPFHTYCNENKIEFQETKPSFKTKKEIILFRPSIDPGCDFITNACTNDSRIKIEKITCESTFISTCNEGAIFLNRATIPVIFASNDEPPSECGIAEIKIHQKTKTAISFPVSWRIKEKRHFEPEELIITSAPKDTGCTFKATYNAEEGDPPTSITVDNEQLSILETSHDRTQYLITIQFTPKSPSATGAIGKLLVSTQSGKTQSMKINYSPIE